MGRKVSQSAAQQPRASSPLAPAAIGRLGLVLGLMVLIPWGISQLPDLTRRSEYRVMRSDIELVPPPSLGIPTNLLDQALDKARLPTEMSLLDERLVEDVAAALAAHPWVAKVQRVQKSMPPRVVVELSYRKPVALVQVKQGFYPVDADGVLLSPDDFTAVDARRYPVIRNVQTNPAAAAGQAWGDPLVVAGARLAESLLEHWQDMGLKAIIVPQAAAGVSPAQQRFELVTNGGSTILWGRPPGATHPGELSVEQKIGRLEKYLAEFGSFDQPHGPYEIDIRHWQEISRRPLGSARANAMSIDRSYR